MKTTAVILVFMILATLITTFMVAKVRNITPRVLIAAIGDLNKVAIEEVDEIADVVIHSVYHQTVSPPITASTASSLIRGISELQCAESEYAHYNQEISHSINKQLRLDGQFEMWMRATVNTSVLIDFSDIDVDIDSAKNRAEITLPTPEFGPARVTEFHASITKASHLSNDESSNLVVSTFCEHIQQARLSARENADSSAILEEVQSNLEVQVREMMSELYPDMEVDVVFTGTDDGNLHMRIKE